MIAGPAGGPETSGQGALEVTSTCLDGPKKAPIYWRACTPTNEFEGVCCDAEVLVTAGFAGAGGCIGRGAGGLQSVRCPEGTDGAAGCRQVLHAAGLQTGRRQVRRGACCESRARRRLFLPWQQLRQSVQAVAQGRAGERTAARKGGRELQEGR